MNDRIQGISRHRQTVLRQHAGSAAAPQKQESQLLYTDPASSKSTDGYDERLTKFRWQKIRHPRFNAKKSANSRWIKEDTGKNNGTGKAQKKGEKAQAGNGKADQSNQQRITIQPGTPSPIPSWAALPKPRTWLSPVTTPFAHAPAFNLFRKAADNSSSAPANGTGTPSTGKAQSSNPGDTGHNDTEWSWNQRPNRDGESAWGPPYNRDDPFGTFIRSGVSLSARNSLSALSPLLPYFFNQGGKGDLTESESDNSGKPIKPSNVGGKWPNPRSNNPGQTDPFAKDYPWTLPWPPHPEWPGHAIDLRIAPNLSNFPLSVSAAASSFSFALANMPVADGLRSLLPPLKTSAGAPFGRFSFSEPAGTKPGWPVPTQDLRRPGGKHPTPDDSDAPATSGGEPATANKRDGWVQTPDGWVPTLDGKPLYRSAPFSFAPASLPSWLSSLPRTISNDLSWLNSKASALTPSVFKPNEALMQEAATKGLSWNLIGRAAADGAKRGGKIALYSVGTQLVLGGVAGLVIANIAAPEVMVPLELAAL